MNPISKLVYVLLLIVLSSCNENSTSLKDINTDVIKTIATDSSDLLINDTIETNKNRVYLFGNFYFGMTYKEVLNEKKTYKFQTKESEIEFKINPKFFDDKLISVVLIHKGFNQNAFNEVLEIYQKKYGEFDKKIEKFSRDCRRNYKIKKVFWGNTNSKLFKYDTDVEIFKNDIIEDLFKGMSNLNITYEGVRIKTNSYDSYNNVILVESRVIENGINHHIILKNSETLDKYLFPVEVEFKNADLVWYEKSIFSKKVDENRELEIITIEKKSDCLSDLKTSDRLMSSLSNAINSIGAADDELIPIIEIKYKFINENEIINEPKLEPKFNDSIIKFNKNRNFEDI